MTRSTLVALLLALSAPAFVAAQEGQSIFAILDASGRSIGPAPALAQGTLSDADPLTGEGRRVQVWRLTGAVGDELQLDLRSDDFDAYVYLVGPGLGGGLTDDDGGEGLDSRICLAIATPGDYRVVASSLSGATGSFTLEVRPREGATSGTCAEEAAESTDVTDIAEIPVAGTLAVGEEVAGSLDDGDPTYFGTPTEVWEVQGRIGDPFSVDLISEDFDPYLELEGPTASGGSDDDGAGRCNARITLTFSEDGTHQLLVTTLGSGRGSYRLVATAAPGPVDPASCVETTETSTSGVDDPDAVSVVGTIGAGESREGTMTGSDTEYGSSFFQAWTLDARAGDRLAIENLSEDFDSYLYLAGPGFPDPLYDDDSAENLDARICVEIPETATYRVLAGPFSGANAGGRYTLQVVSEGIDARCSSFEMTPEAANVMLAELPTEGREIEVGQTLEGTLDPNGVRHPESDRVIQAWGVNLVAGREVTIDLMSEAFDPVLYVLGPDLDEPLYVDDAESGVCNSRVTFTPTESATYRVLAGAFYDGGGGPFTLRVSTTAPEMPAGGCVSPPDTGTPAGAPSSDTGELAGISDGLAVLELGTEIEGSLDALDETLAGGQYAEPWTMDVYEGDEIVFELLSDDFDCILFVDDRTGGLLRDDDGAGNLDSRIVYTATADRTVRVVVSAISAGNSGTFRLRAIRRVR